MLPGITVFAVASRIPQLSRTTWIRTPKHISLQPSWRFHTPNSRGFSRLTTRVTPRNHAPSYTPPPFKSGKLARVSCRLLFFGLGVGAAWYLDKEFYASAVRRNLRTLWTVRILPSPSQSPIHTCKCSGIHNRARLQNQFYRREQRRHPSNP